MNLIIDKSEDPLKESRVTWHLDDIFLIAKYILYIFVDKMRKIKILLNTPSGEKYPFK